MSIKIFCGIGSPCQKHLLQSSRQGYIHVSLHVLVYQSGVGYRDHITQALKDELQRKLKVLVITSKSRTGLRPECLNDYLFLYHYPAT